MGIKSVYQDVILADTKEKAVAFSIEAEKDFAKGIFAESKIWVHSIRGQNCIKEIMKALTGKFKTNKVVFTPLINDNIKNAVRGQVKTMKADDERNPFKEDFEYLECEWKSDENAERFELER